MFGWVPLAMVRIALFFTAGILFAIYFPGYINLQVSSVISVIGLFGYLSCSHFFKGKNLGFVSGLIGLITIFFLGYSHLLLKTDARKKEHIIKLSDPIKSYVATVRSSPESKSKSWKVEVEVTSAKNTVWHPTFGKVLLYVSKKSGNVNWRYGDKLLIQESPQLVRPPANPGEFDFKRFLGFKNIYYQQFILPNQVRWIAATERKGFIYYSHLARAWAMRKMNMYIVGEQEQAIAAALVLGVTEGIDTDLLNAYAASGAMHVLAVSGLHVGIIYAILLLLVRPLKHYSWSRWWVAFICIFCLWSFAFVTGLSPSVLRAVVMFSFIAVARPFGMRTNIYNTLAASAFVLLLYNPYLIMSVGFQLSYLAVLGIVYLQQPIYRLWEIENKIGDWVWQITCVSIAAQLATFSLGLLYFHQFPLYFLISNLFVIPLSTGVLVVGIVLLLVSSINPFALLIGKILTWIVYLLNWTVVATEQLPFSLINNIHLTTFQCWLLMGVIISLILIVEFRSLKWLYMAFLFLTYFTCIQWYHFLNVVNQKEFTVYSISGHRAYEFIDEGQSYFIADSLLLNDQERIRFHIQPNRLRHGVATIKTLEKPPFMRLNHDMQVFEWEEKTIAIVANRRTILPSNLQLDYLVISKNAFPLEDQWLKGNRIGQLIADGSNSRSYINKLSKFAAKANIPLHIVLDQNAFIITN
jgi:competence protein ComEC